MIILLSTSLRLVLAFSFLRFVISIAIISETSLSQKRDSNKLHVSTPTRIYLPTDNTTTFDNLTIFLPYRIRVPSTRTVLRLGFGLPRKKIDAEALLSLLRLSDAVIQEGIDQFGRHTLYPQGPHLLQLYSQLGFGIEIRIHDIRETPHLFTWQNLKETVEGLRLYLVEGKRFYETHFMFWNGPGLFPDLNDHPIGQGAITNIATNNIMMGKRRVT